MKTIDRHDLSSLAETTGERLVSIYMPTYTGANAQQNEIRYANLVAAAEEALIASGMRSSDARQRLAAASAELDRVGIWDEQGPSIAAFIDSDGVRCWRLPEKCDEICRVGRHFHLLPLLASLNGNASYYVLAVSQNEVRLFYGTRDAITPVEVPNLPENLHDALRLDDPEPRRQQHAAARGTPGKQGLVFHGQGGAPDEAKQEILAFCREIDRGLADELRQRSEPLIFAGVDYLFPIYREANRYPHLLETPITGNPELWAPAEIRQRAWPIVETMVHERRKSVLATYGNSIPLKQAVDNIEDVLLAAHAGSVDTLLVDPAAHVTGKFNAQKLSVQLDEVPQDDNDDLVNLATILVLRTSGAVETMEADRVPGGNGLAAVLRYPFSAGRTVEDTKHGSTKPAQAASGR